MSLTAKPASSSWIVTLLVVVGLAALVGGGIVVVLSATQPTQKKNKEAPETQDLLALHSSNSMSSLDFLQTETDLFDASASQSSQPSVDDSSIGVGADDTDEGSVGDWVMFCLFGLVFIRVLFGLLLASPIYKPPKPATVFDQGLERPG